MPEHLPVTAKVAPGDQNKAYAEVEVGEVTVTVYESLLHAGAVCVEVDSPDGQRLAVHLNDWPLHDTREGVEPEAVAHPERERPELPSEFGDAEEDDDGRPRGTCGCGFPIVYTEEGWQHDAAPYFWGNDHDADPDPDAQARAEAWDAEHEED